MAYTTIKKPSDYFNTKLYTGNSGTQSITGVNFQPDFLWIKRRTLAGDHNLVDVIRTSDKTLISNSNGAEYSNSTITSFDSDGFSLSGSDGALNASSNDYASWNWLGSNTTASNTDGSITSTVSANTTSGFSIVSYTGTGANATVGHSLGSVPKMIILKERNPATTRNWRVYHQSVGNDKVLYLDLTNAQTTDTTAFNSTTPTSSVFSLGTSLGTNSSGKNYIAYCFAEKKGYSKFGSYTGNNSNDGTFVYTGFKPAWVMVKRTDSTLVANWSMFDNKRSSYNIERSQLEANTSDAQQTDASADIDLLSNGFKLRSTADENNDGGGNYIYMCFAEEPLVGDNPATAR